MRSRTRPGAVLIAPALFLLLASCERPDPIAPDDPPPDFFVSPTGSPSGDGSSNNPWDLATAFAGPAAVTPGSTIWLRGGTYTNPADPRGFLSTLTGTADAPIVVRQYPGERATVTNIILVRGAYTWLWGFEVTHPAPQEGVLHGVDLRGPGSKAINLVVHDATDDGIFIGPEATGAEVNGSIVYNNGRTDNLTHGIYCRSQAATLLLRDNIVFDNWAYGFHCYANDGPFIQNIDLEGNVAFNNYVWGVPADADILVGGVFPASGITVNENYTYRTDAANTMTADIGGDVVANQDLVLTNNYFAGGWWRMGAWATATVTGNTLYDFTSGGMVWTLGMATNQRWSDNTFFGDSTLVAWRNDSSSATTFPGWRTQTGFAGPGTYAGSAPTTNKIVVRPNRYEPGRANIIVYNWAQQSTVSVDGSGVLEIGDGYVVQNAEDFYGPPIASGIYTGGPLELPMVSITPPSPVGVTTAQPAPVTGPTFNVFVLMKSGRGRCEPGENEVPGRCPDFPRRRAISSPSRALP
ncbi:MAG TPA: right-handed parallel beta-helix repeat-containing protein [Gemmatimonadales bacterium]|nr:right-handed parallel beta-helix repeat-containing protein [Gemmatimonadales bacterium]